jgi:hypothetical protein
MATPFVFGFCFLGTCLNMMMVALPADCDHMSVEGNGSTWGF